MNIVPQFFYKMANTADKELNKPRDAKYLIRFST